MNLGREHLFRREVEALGRESRSLSWLGHWSAARMFLGDAGSRMVRTAIVDPGLLMILEVSPAAGRLFAAEDHVGDLPSRSRRPGANAAQPVVVLSHDLWMSALGGSPTAVGTEIVLDRRPMRVIGVMPPGFFFPDAATEAWLPAPKHLPAPRSGRLFFRNAPTLGRLVKGATASAAGTEATGVLRRSGLRPEDQWIRAAPFADSLTRSVRPTLRILRIGAFLLVIAAAASVTALRLSRAAAEVRASAIRRFLGAESRDEVAAAVAHALLLAGAVGVGGYLVSLALFPLLEPFMAQLPGDTGGISGWRSGLGAPAIALMAVALAELPSTRDFVRCGSGPSTLRGLRRRIRSSISAPPYPSLSLSSPPASGPAFAPPAAIPGRVFDPCNGIPPAGCPPRRGERDIRPGAPAAFTWMRSPPPV